MKSQDNKAIALFGGAAILVLAVGFGGGDLLSSGTTTTTIPGAGAVAIASAVVGAELLGRARADNPPCIADPTNPCPPPVEDSADWPNQAQPETSSLPETQIICQPAGRFGQFCSRQIVQ